MISSEDYLNRLASSIAPYIQELYECTMIEAKTIAKIMYTAMTRQTVVEGSTKTPMGSVALVIAPKYRYPLRFRLLTSRPIISQLNNGALLSPTTLEATLAPEHFAVISALQKKAVIEREAFLDSLQKDTSPELQSD
jgi:hypothetical protein